MSSPRAISYFNPFSNQHNSLEKFNDLSSTKKATVVAITAATTVVSAPILGLGGVAAFRLSTKNLSQANIQRI